MSSRLPLQRELKLRRCDAWRRTTDGHPMGELAQRLGAEGEEARLLCQRLQTYRRVAQAVFPELESCIRVEQLLECAKGKIYIAITKAERRRLDALQQRFGELPLKYNPRDKKYYDTGKGPAPAEEKITLSKFASILNTRNIVSTQLAQVIGRPDVSWQRIARLKVEGKRGSQSELPGDIAPDIIRALGQLSASEPEALPKAQDTPRSTSAGAETSERSPVQSELHITGLGLDISIPFELILEDWSVKSQGERLLKEGKLCVPPVALSEEQRRCIRAWIAKALSQKAQALAEKIV